MDPIGVLVQVKHRRMIHQMVAFLKGTWVSFNKSWEEDTLQKTEACETGSFQKLRWTWKDVTIAEKKNQGRFFKFTVCTILQNHLIIRSPLRKTYGTNLTLEIRGIHTSHPLQLSCKPTDTETWRSKKLPIVSSASSWCPAAQKIAEMHGGNELMDHVNV